MKYKSLKSLFKIVMIAIICSLSAAAQPVLTVTPAGPLDGCPINNSDLTAFPSGAISYEWYDVAAGNCGIPPFSISGQVLLAPPTGIWYCVATWSNGTTSTSNSVNVRQFDASAGLIYQTYYNPVCTTTGNMLYAAPSSPTNCVTNFWDAYQWKKDGINIPGANSYSYHATVSGNYSCRVTNSCGSTTGGGSFHITIHQPLSVSTAVITDTLCGILSVPASPEQGYSYQWYLNGNSLSGQMGYSYRNYPCYGGNYKCRITNACGTFTTPEIPVNFCVMGENISITASGATSFCPGGSVTISAAGGANKTYQWYDYGGAIAGATSQNYVATSTGGYYPVVTNSNGCSVNSYTTYVNANGVQATITAGGGTAFCPGGSVTLSADTGPGFTYQWKKDTVNIAGATSSVYSATNTGSYTVKITAPCGTSVSNAIGVNAATPPVNITPPGSFNLCPGTSMVFNAPAGTGYSYQWRKNGVPITGATGSAYTVAASNPGTFNVQVTAPCGTANSSSVYVYAINLQLPVVNVVGSDNFCSGQSCVLTVYSYPNFSSAYQWIKDGVNITNATSSAFRVTQAENYKITVTNVCGTYTSGVHQVTVNALPSAAITASGPTTFCSGGSVTLSAPSGANKTYQWKKGANLIAGATLSSYTATTGGNYRVIVTNTVTGCSKTTTSATAVTVNALPTATITPQGPTTFCAGESVVLAANTGTALTYQWKKGGNNISGATLTNYTATVGGNYKVEVTNGNGCSKLSAGVTVTVPCKEGETILPQNGDVKVFPNPSSGDFVFEISNVGNQNISINIYNVIGKLILSEAIHDSQYTIRSSQLVPGIYSAEIICEENPDESGQVKKVVKLIKTQQ